jgi:dipeptidyl aminopeptidase
LITCVVSYFVAANPSTERHVYSVPIPTTSSDKPVTPKALTDTTKPSYYSTDFSPGAGFYVLNYQGPGTPWTKVVDTNRPGKFALLSRKELVCLLVTSDFEFILEKNNQLHNATQEYEAATIVQSTFVNEGYGE